MWGVIPTPFISDPLIKFARSVLRGSISGGPEHRTRRRSSPGGAVGGSPGRRDDLHHDDHGEAGGYGGVEGSGVYTVPDDEGDAWRFWRGPYSEERDFLLIVEERRRGLHIPIVYDLEELTK